MKKAVTLCCLILLLLLCACGAPATNEFPSTGQEAAASQNNPTDESNKEAIELTEPAVEETEPVYKNDPFRKTFAVEVRFVVSTADGNTKTLRTLANAVEYHNDMAEPWFNLVSGVNPSEIQQIWLRTADNFPVDHVNCCQCYSGDDDGWFRIDCLQERHNGIMQMEEPYTYQLVSTDEDGNAWYVTFVYVTDDTVSVTEVVQPAAEETKPSYEYENDPTRETFAVEVRFVVAAPDGTTYTVEKKIRAAGPVTNDEVHYWYNEINGINQEDILEIWFSSEELDIDRIYCECCQTFERCEDGWFRLNFHHEHDSFGWFKREPKWPYDYQLIVNVGNGEEDDRYVTLVYID